MFALLSKAGWIIVPIVAGSLAAVALFFERLWALRQVRVNPTKLSQQMQSMIRKRQWSEARVLCQGDKSALARVMWAVLSQLTAGMSKADLKEIAEEAGQREAFYLERGVGTLGVIASLEPLLGLLGTVLGMIKAFQRVELGGVGDPRLVAGGVWVALLTTAAGLTVAIPAYMAYRFLLARVDRLVLDLQNDVSHLLDALHQELSSSGGFSGDAGGTDRPQRPVAPTTAPPASRQAPPTSTQGSAEDELVMAAPEVLSPLEAAMVGEKSPPTGSHEGKEP